jgi:excisionase family DNA binding protein
MDTMRSPTEGRPAGDDEALLTIADACERLSVSRTTLYGLIRTGQVDLVKVGAGSRILASSVQRYIHRLPRGLAAFLVGFATLVELLAGLDL